ncbi:DUF262 domain-containing protein [Flagellimonas hymeniacidonis]|uniref:DUF262 domain-containing protein n=1 Tax=Flagellimonas hymeniacidonis TaxID=2603628 RepID=A0A5C8V3E2_9FLAO|nr:DUF262 domain-containing protein [Flagellimonas hymeniacidonis]TXN36090.1 DUF262 domain-containing protein [Flagellimonas hymeniacidonis]
MKFKIEPFSIAELIRLIDEDLIDLKPYYQRNDIWTRKDQEELIDSIKKGYPLPSFFLYKNPEGIIEMVDGQQRARTIFRYYKRQITDSAKNIFNSEEQFLNYQLSITNIYDVTKKEEVEEFYVLVNKKGKHLNIPEINKAEFSGTNFLRLAETALTYQNFMNLNLFTEATSKRMNDRNFLEELLAYLIHGTQDKKKIISDIYEKDITNDQYIEIEKIFYKIIDRIAELNEVVNISKTRYRQKNDFYTLFSFINENIDASLELHKRQYQILLAISGYISPSNEDCFSLREYAINCVSQSNSKNARKYRLDFFNSILLNKSKAIGDNKILADIADYIDSHQLFDVKFEEFEGYYLMKI